MTLKKEVDEAVTEVAKKWNLTTWSSTTSEVPDPDKSFGYSDGKWVSATYLYSDIMDSSGLVSAAKDEEAVAAIMSAFLKASVRIVRSQDGHIRSFDGDRVMGVFTGASKETRAVVAAMKIDHAVLDLLNPKIASTFPGISRAGWKLRQMTGIATSKALLVRAGIRNNSDLLSVGVGPNLAAKLSDLRTSTTHRTAIGAGTYKALEKRALQSKDTNMWVGPKAVEMGTGSYNYYQSSYHWTAL